MSLQDAVNAAESGQTILLLADNLTASASKTVTVQNGTASEITVTVNGDIQTLEQDATHTFVYSPPAVSTYAITVESSDNGAVTASASRAAAGSRVTLTVAPSEGYVLETPAAAP